MRLRLSVTIILLSLLFFFGLKKITNNKIENKNKNISESNIIRYLPRNNKLFFISNLDISNNKDFNTRLNTNQKDDLVLLKNGIFAYLGVDIDNLYISQPDNGEQALEIADHLISSGAVDLVVVDSVAALTPKSEIEGEMGDSKMGLHARLMSQALRKLTATINKTGCTLIFINQIRMKIGVMFGNPETTTGGNALKFYSSVRLDIRRIAAIKNGDEVIGNSTRVKVVKNKVAPPFRKVEFDIMFGKGISRSGEILDKAVEMGIVIKTGSWFSYEDTKLGQGRDAVKKIIADNPELSEEIETKIKEVSTPS